MLCIIIGIVGVYLIAYLDHVAEAKQWEEEQKEDAHHRGNV